MIVFENKPSTKTPINKDNLNANFSELDGKIDLSNIYGTLGRKSNTTITTTRNWEMLKAPFEYEINWNGKDYLLDIADGHSIKIGNGVHTIEVSGWVTLFNTSVNTLVELHILKNDALAEICGNYSYFNVGDQTKTIIITPQILKVNAGDLIALGVMLGAPATIEFYAQDRPNVGLQIRVID